MVSISDKDWSGEITELTPASNPFETSEASGEDFLLAIREQSGYMRVVDEGNLDGLMPMNNMQHQVEFVVDGVVKWVGYMQAAEYSSEWDELAVVEYPLISAIGVLKGVYLDETKDMGIVTLGALIEESLAATGVDYYGIYIPNEVGAGEWLQPLQLKVSRYNFFTVADNDNDDEETARYDAKTCYEVLEAICAFWGWTLQERGKEFWLSSANVTDYTYLTAWQLYRMASGEEVANEATIKRGASVALESIEVAGMGHRRDVVQGKKRVRVSAELNAVGEVVPEVSMDGREEKLKLQMEYEGLTLPGDGAALLEQMKLYSRSKRIDGKWEDATYKYDYNTGTWSLYNPDMDGYIVAVNGAQVVEYDRYKQADKATKRNYNYTEAIRLAIKADNKTGVMPTEAQAMEMPVLSLLSESVANYESGAFVIEGGANGIEMGYFDADKVANIPSKQTNGKCVLPVMFRVGDKYWNGEEWQSEKAVFSVRVGAQDDEATTSGTGVIVSTKTLHMPYNGADGYVMPIEERMGGDVELVVYHPYERTTTDVVYIDGFHVTYYKDENVVVRDKATNNYSETIGGYEEEKEIKLMMATNNRNAAGYGILLHDTIDPALMSFEKDGVTRPELALLGNLKRHYGSITERLTLEAERTDIMPCDRITWGAKQYRVMYAANNWADDVETITFYEVK